MWNVRRTGGIAAAGVAHFLSHLNRSNICIREFNIIVGVHVCVYKVYVYFNTPSAINMQIEIRITRSTLHPVKRRESWYRFDAIGTI